MRRGLKIDGVVVSAKIPAPLVERLERRAQREDRTMSALIRCLVAEGLERREQAPAS